MTTNKEIKDEFQHIRKDVRDARTPKALKFLKGKSEKTMQRFNKPEVKSSVKKIAMREHNKTLRVISSKSKEIHE